MNVLTAANSAGDTPAASSVNPGLKTVPTGLLQAEQGLARQSLKRYLCEGPAMEFPLNYRYTMAVCLHPGR
jgi:hypothetical protein